MDTSDDPTAANRFNPASIKRTARDIRQMSRKKAAH
jgi:hypothetical protein